MSTVTKPIALNESFNTTDQLSKNIADVMKKGMQDIANAIESHQGGGGHVIVDQNGNALDQEPNMTFLDAHLSDNSTDESTDIEIIKSLTKAQIEALGNNTDGIYVASDETEAIVEPASADKVEVTADGVKSYGTLLNEMFALLDLTKIDEKSAITLQWSSSGADTFYLAEKTNTNVIFTCSYVSNNTSLTSLSLKSSNSTVKTSINGTVSDKSTDVPTSGYKITLYYGTNSAVTNLINQAKYTYLQSGESVESAIINAINGSDVITTSHTILDASASKIGKAYIVNINIQLTSAVSAWTNIGNLKNVTLNRGRYIAGVTTTELKMFLVSSTGNIQCSTSLSSGTEISLMLSLITQN